jgi:hypothetical protein
VSSTKITTQQDGPVLHVRVSGYISENSSLYEVSLAGVTKLILDLSGVTYINSIGVKHWIQWTGGFPQHLQIELHNCPSLIVNQVNMVVGFLPNNGTIESLVAPFICEDCNREENVNLKRGIHYEYASAKEASKFSAPRVPCPKCQNLMELDAIEAKFFNFLKSIR